MYKVKVELKKKIIDGAVRENFDRRTSSATTLCRFRRAVAKIQRVPSR